MSGSENSKPTWSLVVATNSEEILRKNLLGSPEVGFAKEVIIQRNARSAASAYNTGLAHCTSDFVVFAHQDVFLPSGWAGSLLKSLRRLEERDPFWGVAGPFGITCDGIDAGHVYSTGLGRYLGEDFSTPIEVCTLDEMLLIIRRKAGIAFDERLPGFHLYGTDICLEAEASGMRNYTLPCFVLHNSCGIGRLPLQFWKAYMYLRKKWRSRLPVLTPCTKITTGCVPVFERLVTEFWVAIRGTNGVGRRVRDPKALIDELFASD